MDKNMGQAATRSELRRVPFSSRCYGVEARGQTQADRQVRTDLPYMVNWCRAFLAVQVFPQRLLMALLIGQAFTCEITTNAHLRRKLDKHP